MQTIARLVTRSARVDGKVDLIIGSATKGETYLKPNTIYEIREVLDELMIVEVGPSAIQDPGEPSPLAVSWANTVNEILTNCSGAHLLTVKEAVSIVNKEKSEESK
jgi:hypothetical protein